MRKIKRTIFYMFGLIAAVVMIYIVLEDKYISRTEGSKQNIKIVEDTRTNTEKNGDIEIVEKKDADVQSIELQEKLVDNKEAALQRLKTYGEKSDDAKYIYDHADLYPESFLKLGANRPRALAFVRGYADKKNTFENISSKPEESYELNRQYPLYILWDERWGYREYEEPYAIIGCGPTTATMIINGYGGSENPLAIMDEMREKNYYLKNIGTSWEGIRELLASRGIGSDNLPTVEAKYKRHLDTGNPILINIGKSKFTNIGHYMLIVGYNDKGFIINDSNSIEYSLKELPFDELTQIVKGAWTIYKK